MSSIIRARNVVIVCVRRPLPIADGPDAMDHGEHERRGEAEQEHAVQRLERAQHLPFGVEEDVGVACPSSDNLRQIGSI